MKQARAFAYGIWTHHRTGFGTVGLYIAALSIGWHLTHTVRHDLEDVSLVFAFTVMVPMTVTVLYMMAVFCYGFAGDLAGRDSLFPPRLFTLPVRSRELVLWPMLFGCVAIALLWMVTDALALRPAGVGIPVVWPAFAGAAFLAWCQVFMWTPFPIRGVRVVCAIVLLASADACVMVAMSLHVQSSTMIALFAPQLPVAYLLAARGVRRARAGDAAAPPVVDTKRDVAAAPPFKSAYRAQMWVEWKQYGMALPYMVMSALPFELGALFIPGNNNGGVMWLIIELVIATPLVLAATASASVRRYDASTFMATRPLTTASMASVRMQVALLSALLTWAIAIAATVIALRLAGGWPLTVHAMRGFHQIAAFEIAVMIIITWRLLLMRRWGMAWLLAIAIALVPIVLWVARHPAEEAFFFDNLKWIPGLLGIAKVVLAISLVMRLYDEGLASARMLVAIAAAWCVAVLVLRLVLVRIVNTPHIPTFFITTVAILVIPIGQILRQCSIHARQRHS